MSEVAGVGFVKGEVLRLKMGTFAGVKLMFPLERRVGEMRRSMSFLVVFLTLALAAPALAAPPVTETITEKGLTETFVDTTGCPGGDLTHEVTTTYNLIEHVTAFDDGRIHVTFTLTGTFTAVPLDPAGMEASGHFTVWGGFNQNKKSANGTFTLNINGAFEDGTRISVHAVDHFNVTPTGAEFFFSRCHD